MRKNIRKKIITQELEACNNIYPETTSKVRNLIMQNLKIFIMSKYDLVMKIQDVNELKTKSNDT